MALSKVTPFIGTDAAGKAYDQAMSKAPSYRATFTNGETWVLKASNMIAAQHDARFWADFTGRELSSVAGL